MGWTPLLTHNCTSLLRNTFPHALSLSISLVTHLILKTVVFLKVLFSAPFCSFLTPPIPAKKFSHSLRWQHTTVHILLPSRPPRCTKSYSLRNTITQLSAWMTKYLLCLNHSKTEFLIIGFREKLSKLTHSSDLFLTDLTSPVPYTSPVRNLGVIFDKNLTFADHITKLSQICYLHSRDLRRLRPIFHYKTACTIAT